LLLLLLPPAEVLLLLHWRQHWQQLAGKPQPPQRLPLLQLQCQPLCAWLAQLLLHLTMPVLLVLCLLLRLTLLQLHLTLLQLKLALEQQQLLRLKMLVLLLQDQVLLLLLQDQVLLLLLLQVLAAWQRVALQAQQVLHVLHPSCPLLLLLRM
jgi:hypothetical protein